MKTIMKEFKNMGIKPASTHFTGDKIKIDRILNREIVVENYRIEPSKYKEVGGRCLQMQIRVEEEQRVVFTGSKVLIELIEQVEKADFPFKTTIVKEQERFEFT